MAAPDAPRRPGRGGWPPLAPALSLALHGAVSAAALTLRGDAHPPAPAAPVVVAVVTPDALAEPRAAPRPEPAPAPAAAPAPTPAPDPRPPPAPPKPGPALEAAPTGEARAAAAPSLPARPPSGSTPAAPPAWAAPSAPSAPAEVGGAAAERHEAPRYRGAGLANPPPRYPWFARQRGQEGRVVVRVRVGPDGAAESVSIHRSSGYRLLDEAAAAAVAAWRFAPARRDGRPAPGNVDVPVSFRLTE